MALTIATDCLHKRLTMGMDDIKVISAQKMGYLFAQVCICPEEK